LTGSVLQFRLVRLKIGSHTHSRDGMMTMLMMEEISAPRASMVQMEPMISMVETMLTPMVAQNSTRELVMMEGSEVVAAMLMASSLLFPLRSSSWKRVVIKMA